MPCLLQTSPDIVEILEVAEADSTYWAMPETRGVCRREQKGIPDKENSPCKGPEIRVYDAFVCVSRSVVSHSL